TRPVKRKNDAAPSLPWHAVTIMYALHALAPDDPAERSDWRHDEVIANGVKLHFVEAGDPHGDLILLVPGFPGTLYSWHHHMDVLAATGARVIALDLPGFGLSDKPVGVEAYSLEVLAADIVSCIERLTGARQAAALIGHDWGGSIGWTIGALHPDAVRR